MTGIFDIFKRSDSGEGQKSPYALSISITPYRLYANRKSTVMAMVKVKNLSKEPLMTSVDIDVPDALSFDEMGMVRRRTFKLGNIEPGKESEFRTNIVGGLKTDKGDYTVGITATAHYRDYDHVVNVVKKMHTIGVV
jgi:hypothetical protein